MVDNPSGSAALLALRKKGIGEPRVAIILGSGFSTVLNSLVIHGHCDYSDLPGWPQTSVSGHPGRCVWARWGGQECIIFAGRFHGYEGLDSDSVCAPVSLASALGCREILLTCAAGALSPDLPLGALVAIEGHLSFGHGGDLKGRLSTPDIVRSHYSPTLTQSLLDAGDTAGDAVNLGVLASVPGPSYETSAEVNMLRSFGADVVSMSTATEAQCGTKFGIEIAALACVTNVVSDVTLQHSDVVDALSQRQTAIGGIIESWLNATPPPE